MEYNLADLFEAIVDVVPEREALICGARRLTYAETDARANRLAHHLAAHGVGGTVGALLTGVFADMSLNGLFNGALVAALRITPFIVTLGTMSALRGVAKGLAGEQKIDADPRGLDLVLFSAGATVARSEAPRFAAAGALVVPDRIELASTLEACRRRLELGVRALVAQDAARLGRLGERLRAAPRLLLERRRSGLDHAGARLQALSPLATLGRGYAIVRAHGEVVRDAAVLSPGDRLEVELASGGAGARVEDVRP